MDAANPTPTDGAPSDAQPAQPPVEQDTRNSLRHILADEPVANAASSAPAPAPAPEQEPEQEAPSTPVATQAQPTAPAPASTSQPPPSQPALQPRIKEEAAVSTPGPNSPLPTTPAGASGSDTKPMYTATTTTTRRNANGSVSSVYSGNKIRHLKKEDGVPLWRKDIQYDFLKYVFEDEQKVFHKVSDKTPGHTFADIYLDAMAKSSKCSKILKDKLLTERPAALNMAMVCLLVNVGRMNTTLNFFPEMRAQLRTYHSIPSLQAHQDPNAYKQLQDAPRLKSILKGATEDVEQPSTLEDIRNASIPRTNPVNLIFVLAQYAPKISEMHFDVPRDFFDLVMKSGLSSRSRATAFLWLMWWYLESDFTSESALANPYGPGRRSRDADEKEMPIKCPQFEILTEEQAHAENVDTQEEIDFGEIKRKERVAILATDLQPVITGPKRSGKKAYNQGTGVFSMASDNDTGSPAQDNNSPAPSQGLGRSLQRSKGAGSVRTDDQYDSDRTRSASPSVSLAALPLPMKIDTLLNNDKPTAPAAAAPAASAPAQAVTPAPTTAPAKGPGRGNWGHRRKENHGGAGSSAAARSLARAQQHASEEPDSSSFAGSRPHGFYLPLNGAVVEPKRSRPLTSHQLAVERYRKERVDFILDRGIRKSHTESKKKRVKEGALLRTWRRCNALPNGFDSEEEDLNSDSVPAREGVAARALLMMASLRPSPWEQSDWGEEAGALASGMRRVRRRTERWETGEPVVRRKYEDGGERLAPVESMEGVEVEGDYEGRGSSMPPGMDYEGEGDDDMDEDEDGEE